MPTPAKKELPALHSEWPITDLVDFVKSLAERFQRYYNGLKVRSPWLNPTGVGGMGNTGIFDVSGLRSLYREYTRTDTKQDDYGRDVPQGIVPNCEFKLKGLWRDHERLSRLRGASALPAGPQLMAIVERAVEYKILLEESRKMAKLIAEDDARQQVKADEKKAKQLFFGGYKRRPDGSIREIDGMEVVDGIVTEMGMSIDEYREECRIRHEQKRAARNANFVQSAT